MKQGSIRRQVGFASDHRQALELIGLKLGIPSKAQVAYKLMEFMNDLIDQASTSKTLYIRSNEGEIRPVPFGVFLGLTRSQLNHSGSIKLGLSVTSKQDATLEKLMDHLHLPSITDCFRYVVNVFLALLEHTNEGDVLINEAGQVIFQL